MLKWISPRNYPLQSWLRTNISGTRFTLHPCGKFSYDKMDMLKCQIYHPANSRIKGRYFLDAGTDLLNKVHRKEWYAAAKSNNTLLYASMASHIGLEHIGNAGFHSGPQ